MYLRDDDRVDNVIVWMDDRTHFDPLRQRFGCQIDFLYPAKP